MRITLTDDLDRFTQSVGGWLAQSPVDNNVLLAAIRAQRAGHAKGTGPATYGWATDDGTVVGAIRWPPPLPATMTAMPDTAAHALAAELARRSVPLPGVSGPSQAAASFAGYWQEATGQPGVHVRDLLISQLDQVRQTMWPPGRMRPARAAELELLAGWIAEILAGAGLASPSLPARQQVEEQFAASRLFVWEDQGQPVAVTGHTAPVGNVVLLAGGYTSPEHRTSWYGTALAAAVAGHLLSQGMVCISLTDRSNPHAGAALRMVGYRPVLELSDYRFQPVPDAAAGATQPPDAAAPR